jgi:anaerobic magnesium-protoporphyrin IX monomethyl ester cyclase
MDNNNSRTYLRLKEIPLPHEAKITKEKHFGLIIPPSPFVVPCGWEWCHRAPLEGPSNLATLVKVLVYKFTLLDQREDFDPQSLEGKLKQFDFIGISTYEDGFPFIKEVIELAKKANPQAPVLLGGPLVTSVPELILNNTKADYAVVGEGELTLIELLDHLEKNEYSLKLDEIDGLVYKSPEGNVLKNKSRKQIHDLDAVPFQDFSVWEKFQGKEIPEIYLSASRGCPFGCSFCFRTMPLLREKSIERVKKEVEYLKKYHFKHVWWNDLCFVVEKERASDLLDKVFVDYRFSWNCFSRVTDVDLPILNHMKQKGCDIILYGFEAISQDILNSYKKKICRDDMSNAIQITKEAGIKVGGLFIIGAPEETKESLNRIIDFSKKFKEITRVKYLSALPGTPLYKRLVSDGTIKNEIDHLYFLAREQSVEEDIDEKGFLFMAKNISKEDLRNAYKAVNTVIEVRPYQYHNSENLYLEKPRKFKKRVEN